MRRLVIACIAFIFFVLHLGESRILIAAEFPYQNKTLHLRSGPITLEPTQMLQPFELNDIGQLSIPGGREPTAQLMDDLSGQTNPFPSNERTHPGLPRPISRPLDSDRAILSFERRVTAAEREALLQRGIEVGEYLGSTAYIARYRQKRID